MAAADKTYINKAQYAIVKAWWLKTRKKQKRELGAEIWMYPFDSLTRETYDNGYDNPPVVHYSYDPADSDLDIENMGDDSPVWNTSTKQNLWIIKNCPLDFIQEQIKEKLSYEFYQKIPDELNILSLVDKMDFTKKDKILSIETISSEKNEEDISLYFYDDEFYYLDFYIYGTTLIYKILNNVMNLTYSDKIYPYKIEFMYCGLIFTYIKGNIYFDYNENLDDNLNRKVHIPFFSFSKINVPNFKHMWNANKANDLNRNQIILSFDKKVYNMSCYSDSDNATNKRLLFELPEYIRTNLKY